MLEVKKHLSAYNTTHEVISFTFRLADRNVDTSQQDVEILSTLALCSHEEQQQNAADCQRRRNYRNAVIVRLGEKEVLTKLKLTLEQYFYTLVHMRGSLFAC